MFTGTQAHYLNFLIRIGTGTDKNTFPRTARSVCNTKHSYAETLPWRSAHLITNVVRDASNLFLF